MAALVSGICLDTFGFILIQWKEVGTQRPSLFRSKDQNPSCSPTFLVPLHADSVGLEEALVGERSGGSSQRRVLIQTDKGRCSFAARDVDGYLDREDRTGGTGVRFKPLSVSPSGGRGSSPCWAELQVTTQNPTLSACEACWRCCL